MTLLDSRLPLVAAPMAGGPSTLALARAVSSAGAFPFLAGGNLSPQAMAADIAAARGLGTPFGVNLFVLPPREIDEKAFAAFVEELEEDAADLGVALDSAPRRDDDHFSAKLALLLRDPVPVVSFTFGLPPAAAVSALREVGTSVLASVTDPEEARAAAERGVDGLVVQAPGAGGHSATHDPSRTPGPISTEELVRQVRAAVDLPLLGAAWGGRSAGGATDPRRRRGGRDHRDTAAAHRRGGHLGHPSRRPRGSRVRRDGGDASFHRAARPLPAQ